ncbi:TENM2 [Cordylochernes scorpioides]|uniref:TENM2 n=1 Tax=Cordylochernes scorpioides TaxID=51811 RepID=A0ABY6L863_9ARAC|nr:TENM2 [Cordylochernes scorpioides]
MSRFCRICQSQYCGIFSYLNLHREDLETPYFITFLKEEVNWVDTQVAFLRDSGNRVHTIETARGHKCRVAVTTQGLFETLTDPDQLTTRLEYDAGGLLTSRADAAGRATFYLYDENGRLTDLVRASGRVTSLTFDLGPGGATVQAREEGAVDLLVTVRGTTVISQQGDEEVINRIFHFEVMVRASRIPAMIQKNRDKFECCFLGAMKNPGREVTIETSECKRPDRTFR